MWRLWRLMHPGKAGDALVAPHFSEVEETASGGRYGGGCAPGGRVGSGGGWVVGLLLVGVIRDITGMLENHVKPYYFSMVLCLIGYYHLLIIHLEFLN